MKTKTKLYTNERKIILYKIFDILNIYENNNTFFLGDLDSDQKIQKQILCVLCFANYTLRHKSAICGRRAKIVYM